MVSDLDGPSNGICAICGEASNIVPKERHSSSDGFIFKPRSTEVMENLTVTGEGTRKREREEELEGDEEEKDMFKASVGGRLPFLIAPLCKCRAQCALARVRKSGPTMHRLFWAYGLFPKCPRHNVVCILRRVLKDGPNNGRYFFYCSVSSSSSRGNSAAGNAAPVCNTFIWAEKAAISSDGRTTTNTGSSADLGSKKLKASQTIVIPL
eukprot:gene29909-39079_t